MEPRANDVPGKLRVRRAPTRGRYDRASIDSALDSGLLAHVAFLDAGVPVCIPMLHARIGDRLYIHGSTKSRMIRTLAAGTPACVTVTVVHGLVLARSAYEHSANYASAVLFGTFAAVEGADERIRAFEAFTEKLLPGRWAESRPPTASELKATSILRMPLDEASAKIRDGGPEDGDTPDAELDVWAGHVPFVVRALDPVPDPSLRPGIPVPPALRSYRRPGLVE